MTKIRNIALWFGSLVLAISLFSLLFGPGAFLFVFRVTMMFAFPVACLYLPVVMALRDTEEGRIWTILASGTLMGPACLVLWGFILDLGGHAVWQSDDIGLGLGAGLAMALVVGFLTTVSYVTALKIIH